MENKFQPSFKCALDEALFTELLNLRKYLLEQADALIAIGFDINSDTVNKFFKSCGGIISHIERILGLKTNTCEETTIEWALESLDAGKPFIWYIDKKKHHGNSYYDLWILLQEEVGITKK